MHHAILVTAYKNLEQLIFLINHFDEKFYFFIHIDKKSKVSSAIIDCLKSNNKVHFVSRKFKVNWGGRNHLLAILELCKVAISFKNISYFHLISGEDMPLKSSNSFREYFSNSLELNFLENFELPAPFWFKENGGFDRIKYYNFYDLFDGKKKLDTIEYLVNIQKKYGISRNINFNFDKIYAGSTWWSLSRNAIDYVLLFSSSNNWFLKKMKFTFCSEELYFQTILLNSPLANLITNNNLRYIVWQYRNNSCPAYLDESDFHLIKQTNALFARKINHHISKNLISLINFNEN